MDMSDLTPTLNYTIGYHDHRRCTIAIGISDSMDGNAILERIIEEDGSCCWAKPSICAACPLGRLARNETGGFMSCVEALNIDGLSEEEADARYKQAALTKIADLALDQVIEAD